MQDADRRTLKERYIVALREQIAHADEATLQRAYEIGRRAIGDGVGVLELVAMHQEVLEEILREHEASESCVLAVGDAGRFLGESLSSVEMAHRGFQEAVTVLRRLNQMLEEEARRIAHALHDDAGQILVTVHLALQEAASGLPPRSRARLEKVRDLLDEIEKRLRRLSHELRPTVLDDLGLLPALEYLAQGVASRSGIPIVVEGPRTPRLPPAYETALYRVVQEALRNASKHALARRVNIRFSVEPGVICCLVKDDGRGFDVAAAMAPKGERGLGLIGMRERLVAVGGRLAIDSAPGRGTELRITIPWEEHDADSGPSGR